MQIVWVLYDNYGGGSRVVGIFSDPDVAKTVDIIALNLRGDWEIRGVDPKLIPYYYCKAFSAEREKKDFYFTVEPVKVDRLLNPMPDEYYCANPRFDLGE